MTREELIKQLQEIRGYLSYFLDIYIEYEREVWLTMLEKVEKDADLILDGLLPVEKLADELILAVKMRIRK